MSKPTARCIRPNCLQLKINSGSILALYFKTQLTFTTGGDTQQKIYYLHKKETVGEKDETITLLHTR